MADESRTKSEEDQQSRTKQQANQMAPLGAIKYNKSYWPTIFFVSISIWLVDVFKYFLVC